MLLVYKNNRVKAESDNLLHTFAVKDQLTKTPVIMVMSKDPQTEMSIQPSREIPEPFLADPSWPLWNITSASGWVRSTDIPTSMKKTLRIAVFSDANTTGKGTCLVKMIDFKGNEMPVAFESFDVSTGYLETTEGFLLKTFNLDIAGSYFVAVETKITDAGTISLRIGTN